MSDNIYRPPLTQPEITNTNFETMILASRWQRLGASILDSLIIIVITIPVMFLTGGFDGITDGTNQQSLLYNVSIAIVGFVVFFGINFKFLINSGQTIGKKALGIKITDMEGNLPTLKGHLLDPCSWSDIFISEYTFHLWKTKKVSS